MSNTKYCKKIYSDLPFAHRQHKHTGHCSKIHGHSWSFEFEFAATELDHAGFVVDFGALKELKAWINEHFDHTLVMNRDDPLMYALLSMKGAAYVTVVDSCSSEGIASHIAEYAGHFVRNLTGFRTWLHRVTVHEDSKNSATLIFPTDDNFLSLYPNDPTH